MREIKFRAWWKDTMEPIEDFMEEYLIGVLDGKPDNPFIYSQFTGLKDCHGKEIYEGDIVRIGLFALNDTEKFGETPWNNLPDGIKEDDITTVKNTFAVEWSFLQLHNLRVIITDNPDVVGVEVIGNIYTNPELI